MTILNHVFFLHWYYAYSLKLRVIKSYRNKMQGSNDRKWGFMIRRPASPSIILIDGDAGRRIRSWAQMHTLDNFDPCIFSLLELYLFLNLRGIKSYRKKMQGSNDNFEPCIYFYGNYGYSLKPKSIESYRKKMQGSNDRINLFWFGVPHLHLLY